MLRKAKAVFKQMVAWIQARVHTAECKPYITKRTGSHLDVPPFSIPHMVLNRIKTLSDIKEQILMAKMSYFLNSLQLDR